MLSSVFLFLNIGGSEMVLIVLVALMLFGGNKLPEIARGLGKGIRDFKDASEDVKREINNQINNYEEKKIESKVEEVKAEEKANAYEPVAGTLPAFEGTTATDAIEDDATVDVVSGASADNYQFDAEVKHPVTGTKNTAADVAEEGAPINEVPVDDTTEEKYK